MIGIIRNDRSESIGTGDRNQSVRAGQMVAIICVSFASGVYIWNSFDYWMRGISYWWVRFLVSAVLLLAAIVASRKLLQAFFAKSP